MRVGLLTGGFLLTSAIVSLGATVNMVPPPPAKTQAPTSVPAKPAAAKTPAAVTVPAKKQMPAKTQALAAPHAPAKAPPPVTRTAAKFPNRARTQVTCPCDCPDGRMVRHHAQAHLMRAPIHMARRVFHRYVDNGYYRDDAAAPVIAQERHGQWRVAPDDAYIPGPVPGPMAYGPPPPSSYPQGVQVDDRGWTGGVGAPPDGGGGFVDGYGQVHFANGGGAENGPTYNSYDQSFQFNPSQAGPFQPRLMGGLAPAKK